MKCPRFSVDQPTRPKYKASTARDKEIAENSVVRQKHPDMLKRLFSGTHHE